MKIIIPMAGRGSRFTKTNEYMPKPLISIAGRPMVSWAFESLIGFPSSQIFFIALEEHEDQYGVTKTLKEIAGLDTEVLLIPDVTDGQLCTILAARDIINSDEDVLVASSDTYIRSNLINDILNKPQDCHGIISVADLPGDRWSFARTDDSNQVVEVAEKIRISDHASTGLYYFSSGKELVLIGEEIIQNGEKTRGEYYVIPIYQKFIERGWRVSISIAEDMWDMGTPEALDVFEKRFKPNGEQQR